MSSMDKSSETKEKILQTTLELVKREGFEAVTVRKIAAESGTNLSLVNYYFGSKDKLISEAIKVLLASFQGTFTILDDTTIAPKARLKQFLFDYVSVLQQYPELVSRIFAIGGAVFASQQEYGQFLKTIGFDKMKAVLAEITGEADPAVLMMMVMQLSGAVFLPALLKQILATGADTHIASLEQQLDLLFAHYFHQ